MSEEPRPAVPRSRGAGVLLQTEVERVPLGVHEGRRLTARVEHRTLRLALGRWWAGSLTLGRRRPVAIEVVEERARLDAPSTPGTGLDRYDEVAVPAPVDPWARYARRVAAVAVGGWLLTTAVRRTQAARRTTGDAP